MDEIFNPSLLISLGPSSKKALEFSQKLMECLPPSIMNLVEHYHVEDPEKISLEVQEILDTRLLAARNLNELVDMGFKVRGVNVNSVKVNVYLLWDVYDASLCAPEVVKALAALNYGNMDRNQHSGATFYIIPIMEREWLMDEEAGRKCQESLKQVIDFVSEEDSVLRVDSKVYVMHCVGSDGTRIPKEELECICGILVYLNVMPSQDPPFGHFNKRLLMHEGKYKVGTLGIACMTVLKHKLLEEFSRCMARDVLERAARGSSTKINHDFHEIFPMTDYESHKNFLKQDVNLQQQDGVWKLGHVEKYDVELPEDMFQYWKVVKNWEQYIQHQCLTDMKKKIDGRAAAFLQQATEEIDKDVQHVAALYSLKEAENYLDQLECSLEQQRQKQQQQPVQGSDTTRASKRLRNCLENCPNGMGFAVKATLLGMFFLYSMINILFPIFQGISRVVTVAVLMALYSLAVWLEYDYRSKKLEEEMEEYKEKMLEKGGTEAKVYLDKVIFEGQRAILEHMEEKRKFLQQCMKNARKASEAIAKEPQAQDEMFGDLVTDLLDLQDRRRFYEDNPPEVHVLYADFMSKLGDYSQFAQEDLKHKALEYARSVSPSYVDLDFYEYMKFKYGDDMEEQLSCWIDKAVVKSRYLLQFVSDESLEEHCMFITSPQVYRISKDMVSEKMNNCHVSVVEGKDMYTNCISVIRLCLGVDFSNMTPVMSMKRGEVR